MTPETLAQKFHEWYLEACQRPESGMDFNPAAQEPYEALKETQKFLDRYIAGKVLDLIQEERAKVVEEAKEKVVKWYWDNNPDRPRQSEVITLLSDLQVKE